MSEKKFDWENDTWKIVDRYFMQDNVKVQHHINSYNHFMIHELPKIVKEKEFQVKVYADYDDENQEYLKEYQVEFGDIYISKPVIHENNGTTKPMYPNDARLRNLTYDANIYVDIKHRLQVIDEKTREKDVKEYPMLLKFDCGKIPVMLKSKFCILSNQSSLTQTEMGEGYYDPGGYFIIRGSEKAIICQERKLENKVQCFKQKSSQTKYSHECEILSVHHASPSYAITAKVKLSSKEHKHGKTIYVNIRSVRTDIPLVIIFRALNIISDKSIVEMIVNDVDVNKDLLNLLKGSIYEGSPIKTQKMALEYISKFMTTIRKDIVQSDEKKIKYTYNKVLAMLFPHLGNNTIKKAYFLGYMVKKMLNTVLKKEEYDDRDSFLNKKIETTGELVGQLFRAHFSKYVKDMKSSLDKDARNGHIDECGYNLNKKFKPNDIEGGIRYAFSTGTWGSKNQAKKKSGIAHVLQRLSSLGTISELRRIVAPLDKTSKQVEVRKLHSSSWGTICPLETPEGAPTGLVKNMAMTCNITVASDPSIIKAYLDDFGVEQLETVTARSIQYSIKVFINGDWYGQTFKPKELVDELRVMRRNGVINIFTSIAWKIWSNEIHIRTDGGRMCRPLYLVKNNKLVLTPKILKEIEEKDMRWNDIVKYNLENDNPLCENPEQLTDDNCIIEYIDIDETDTAMIAMSYEDILKNSKENDSYKEYTHCELHPAMILGALVSEVSCSNHNQGVRNCYQSSMGKQAIGVYSTAFRERMDTTVHVLHYPQKRICNTRTSKYFHSNEVPPGENCIVAIACYTGFNMEDSLIFSQGAIDRGLMRSNYYRTYRDEEKKNQSTLEDEKFEKPEKTYPNGKPKTEKMSYGSYDKLSQDGFVKVGTRVMSNDVIIGKVIPLKNTGQEETKYRDASTKLRANESGTVDKVYVNRNAEGYRFCKVRVKSERIPEIGDKFASSMGQKGTISMTYNQEDMPFTKDGVVPDLIVNPHAIPSRMTIGQLIECALSKIGALQGIEFDATSFRNVDIDAIGELMEKHGFKKSGKEVMYNGKTGEQIEADIFIGPTFYYRLKHLVKDKIHSRLSGPLQLLTRQPAEGRARDGGLRFGEMERDCSLVKSSISLSNGLSIKIKEMQNVGWTVLSWDSKSRTIVNAKQTHYLDKGERPCLELRLQDDRTVTYTEDHPLLTSEGKWVKVKDLDLENDKLIVGMRCPEMDIKQEIDECDGWSLDVGKLILNTHTAEEYLRTLAFVRIIGLLITDGHITKRGDASIFLGHKLDVKQIQDDFKLLKCNIIARKKPHCYRITIPRRLSGEIIQLKGLVLGNKVKQESKLPEFVLDKDCPKPILREFMAGMFGGDGHTSYLGLHRGKRDLLTSVSFSKSKVKSHLESHKKYMTQIAELLTRLGIPQDKITLQKPKMISDSKNKEKNGDLGEKTYEIVLHIDMEYMIYFAEKIGFRYCCHKSQRLDAAISYKQLRRGVVRQRYWLINRVGEITNYVENKTKFPEKSIRTKKAIDQAVKELEESEGILHKYAIPTKNNIYDTLIRGCKFGSFRSKSFPIAGDYMKEIGAIEWFDGNFGVDPDADGLPTMNLKIVSRRDVGMKEVCDISVEDTHSFLAEGVVSHNCMIGHGAVQFLKERMFDCSDKYCVWIDKETGMISPVNPKKNIYKSLFSDNTTNFDKVNIPYASKLLIQELTSMHIVPRIRT